MSQKYSLFSFKMVNNRLYTTNFIFYDANKLKMALIPSPFPNWKCPIEEVTGIWRTQIPSFHTNLTKVPPDHNIQLVLSGQYRLRINDHEYQATAGSMIYYFKGEDVHWLENEEPVSFYSIVFKGSLITPLPIEKRIVAANLEIATEFQNIFQASLGSFGYLNHLQVYCGLLRILKEINFYFLVLTIIILKFLEINLFAIPT